MILNHLKMYSHVLYIILNLKLSILSKYRKGKTIQNRCAITLEVITYL